MTKYFLLFVVVFLKSILINAQEATSVDSTKILNEVIVVYQANKLTPFTFQDIPAKELKAKSTGQEPSFLLSETPSITNYSDAGNSQGYSYFRMRGIDQTRVNITLDGVPLNEPEDQGAYFSNYPDIVNSVSKIQIQRGVGTSKNGVASYAGSIQLFSPKLQDSAKTTVGIDYGSFNSVRAFGIYNSGIKNKKAFYIRASQIYSDGYKYNSSNNSQSVFLSTGLFNDTSTWKLNILAGQQKNELAWLGVADSLIQRDRRTNANENEKDRFVQALAQLQHKWKVSTHSSLQSSVYYTYLTGDYDFNLNTFLGLPSTEELFNYDFQSNLLGFFSNYRVSKKKFNWTTGIHGNVYEREHRGSERSLGDLYKNMGHKNEISIFSKLDFMVNDFSFFADIQYRYTSFDYTGSVNFDPRTWHFVNPKIGVSFKFQQGSLLYYSLGSTGREPTRNDIFGGNDDLLADDMNTAVVFIEDPEYVVDHELGWRFSSKNLTLDMNLYYMDFSNEIVLQGNFGPNGLALTNNVEESYRTGVEVNAVYSINHNFSLINNSSFNYIRIKEQSEVFSPILTPPVLINQELVYTHNNLVVGLSARYQDDSYMDFANTAAIDAYVLLNSRIQYALERYQFSVFVNNITNTTYFNNGYVDFDGTNKFFVQAPTNFHVAIQYSF
ncbi:TonB-dependent receptor [Aquimarina addita]|uniref:TonB-dependent receptor n=1 Tax=Aquimarina addita TaxID=870485 RepID=A0ABP6UR78_9FLAO